MSTYEPPSNWGHLQLLDTRRVPIMGTDYRTGLPYVMDTHGPITMFFRCDCGFEFTMERSQFPGRRRLKYCMRPECQYAPKPRTKRDRSDPGKMQSVYLHESLIEQVHAWAAKRDMTYSAAIRELVLKGLVNDLVDSD